jgi:tol-pal system protein YbgF
MNDIKLKWLLPVVVLSSMATLAFADTSAPVYDADNYSPQVENQVADNSDNSVDSPVDNSDDSAQTQPDSQSASPQASTRSMSTQQRLARLEQQLNNLQGSDSSAVVNSLQSDVQSLRGQVEDLNRQVSQLQTQVRTNYTDLDKRLAHQPAPAKQQLADATPAAAPPTADKAVDASKQPNVAEEQQIYQTAYNYIKAKKYNEAVAALQNMLQKYPSGQFAANAHYWLGELYGLMNKNKQSAAEFNTIVSNYPDSPKVSDAQLKLGLIFASETNWSEAKSAFRKVINRYPGTTSARVASEQLKQIKLAGH